MALDPAIAKARGLSQRGEWELDPAITKARELKLQRANGGRGEYFREYYKKKKLKETLAPENLQNEGGVYEKH